MVRVKAVYLSIGITMVGGKEVLNLWLAQTEGAEFWLQVMTELRNRGVQDIFMARLCRRPLGVIGQKDEPTSGPTDVGVRKGCHSVASGFLHRPVEIHRRTKKSGQTARATRRREIPIPCV